MASAEDAPVSDREAADLFAPLRDRAGVALAVSGGSDSCALLLLYARARALDPTLPPAVVLSVDHGLRPEAAAEAAFVAARARAHRLPHRLLAWTGTPAGNLQAEARAARYGLLIDAAHDLGLDTLLTAHHAEDQAETFLARLARGSGVVGLGAIAPARTVDGVLLMRPFLNLPKARLVATLSAAGETWCEDPSNRDRRFDRVRTRQAAAALAELGLTRDRLVATARAMRRAAEALDAQVDDVLARGVVVHPAGWATLDPDTFATAPDEVRLRLLARLTRMVTGAPYGPRLERLEALDRALTATAGEGRAPARTLGGLRIERRRGRIWFSPERGRGEGPSLTLTPGASGRFRGARVALDAAAPAAVTIAALGSDGRRTITATSCPVGAVLGHPAPSAAVIESAPAVWVKGELVACPGLGYEAKAAVRWSDLVRFAR